MDKSAQDMFNDVVKERDKPKKEINKWIYTTQKMERMRDKYKEVFGKVVRCIASAVHELDNFAEEESKKT